MSLREVSKYLGCLESAGVASRSISGFIRPTTSEDQLAVNKKIIRLHSQKFRLYGAVDPQTNETHHVSLYLMINKQTTRWFLTELHAVINLVTRNFLSMTQTISDQFLLKMAIDFRSFDMEIGMPSNLSSKK
ncbi:hypothetical protein PN414_12235 [Halorubrum ezzemoulense]|nr:hypothetical protein [Halorubrum ezzemoulense]MDB9259700.1 hypothetical protein [Halorubrum ezzemoulense]MDB9263165.1 hypothetical protein [Halorubrum ezzemoulense]MDB9266405.1 hypothetical protein [Halorubrum ezzemoulense]MDB9270061.1 hypothetical protein [Halorubrum ezzemoulense]MDB9273143.1 hypothetical protein [Halorubrum ezzemoulense]